MWSARASSSSLQWAGLVSQQDSCLPFPRPSLGPAAGTGVNQSGFRGAAKCPEPAVPLPMTDLLAEPWTFLTALWPRHGVSNVILLSLASVWEVMSLGVGALVRGKVPEGKFPREASKVDFCGNCWLFFLNSNSLINK